MRVVARDKGGIRNGAAGAPPGVRFRDRCGETLFIDARKLGTMIDRVHCELTDDDLAARTGVAYPTATRAIEALARLGIVREITGRSRDRVFAYDGYIAILNEGAEPL